MAREPDPPSSPERGLSPGPTGPGKLAGGRGPHNAQQAEGDSISDTLLLLARIAGIGWTVAIAILAGAGAGWWLDRQFGTRPWLTLAGVALGAVVAFTAMIRLLRSVAGAKRKNGKPT